MGHPMHELVGQIILGAFISDDKMSLGFRTQLGTSERSYRFDTEGGCCSHSWIEHVENAENLTDAKVLAVEDVEMPEPPQEEHEHLQAYGVRLVLEGRAPFMFEFRNSSNGYYSGYIVNGGKSLSGLTALTTDF